MSKIVGPTDRLLAGLENTAFTEKDLVGIPIMDANHKQIGTVTESDGGVFFGVLNDTIPDCKYSISIGSKEMTLSPKREEKENEKSKSAVL